MSRSFTITIRPLGSLSLGGVTGVDRDQHNACARDRDGRPYIPATALRGALRNTLEALLRGADLPACAGGTGLPAEAAQDERPRACLMGQDGRRCIACRLFGGQRDLVPEGETFFSALIVGDATTDQSPDWTVRPTVGMARSTRSADHQILVLRKLPAPTQDLAFIAVGRLLDPELEPPLRAALAATTHLGAGRSRGLGRVELALVFDAPGSTRPQVRIADTDEVRLRITLSAPTSLGVANADDNLRDTRREVPGAALRGAIGFALAEALHKVHTRERPDPAFEQLVAEDGARFSFFYPVDDSSIPTESAVDPTPLPNTALECKFEGRKHCLVDGLLDAIAASLADEPAIAQRVAETVAQTRCSDKKCSGPLRNARGPRSRTTPLATRTITRLAMDRTRDSARNEMLFSQILLDPGTSFEGSIHHIPPTTKARLELALQQPLSIGRGRSSGWGRIEITHLDPLELPTIDTRAHAFHRALSARLTKAGLSAKEATRWIPITLLAPLIPEKEDEDGETALLNNFPGCSVPFKARRFTREGGWDQREHGMQPALAVAAGAVFALRLPDKMPLSSVLPQLTELERDGLGQRRHQGYGTLRCFDPFHR